MDAFWKFLDDNWILLLIFGGGVLEWIGEKLDLGLIAIGKRRRAAALHRENLRALELETRRRELEQKFPAPPAPIEAICGCGHHLSFHAGGKACNEATMTKGGVIRQCRCQNYVGPPPLSQVYPDPLADL